MVIFSYYPIFLFVVIAFGVSCLFVFLSWIIAKSNSYVDKNSTYECGFEKLSPISFEFDVRFYIIAILFVIFDVEIIVLFPWAIALKTIGVSGFLSMMLFLFILLLGFAYEWKKGALEWQ